MSKLLQIFFYQWLIVTKGTAFKISPIFSLIWCILFTLSLSSLTCCSVFIVWRLCFFMLLESETKNKTKTKTVNSRPEWSNHNVFINLISVQGNLYLCSSVCSKTLKSHGDCFLIFWQPAAFRKNNLAKTWLTSPSISAVVPHVVVLSRKRPLFFFILFFFLIQIHLTSPLMVWNSIVRRE